MNDTYRKMNAVHFNETDVLIRKMFFKQWTDFLSITFIVTFVLDKYEPK
jgi:hypothetical protein